MAAHRLFCTWDSPGKNTGGVAISFSNACMHAKLLQSCLTLCDPMDSSPPGSSVHGIFQARVLEWVAISFSNQHHSIFKKKNFFLKTNIIVSFKKFYCVFLSQCLNYLSPSCLLLPSSTSLWLFLTLCVFIYVLRTSLSFPTNKGFSWDFDVILINL